VNDHPVRLVVTDDLRRSRLTVLFRLLLAIPHIIWVILWTVGVFFLSIVGWVVALFRARLPKGLHDFFAMYIRYVTHLGAYLTLAANPYPGFIGAPGYPVDVELPDEPQRQNRWTVAFRLFLALPALVLASVLGWGLGGGGGGSGAGEEPGDTWWATGSFGGVATICGFLGWFASLALARMPLGIRNLGAYGLGYSAQAYAYGLLVTSRYANADPDAVGPAWEVPPHPVRLELNDDGRRSRLTVFFRLLLTIPHFVWLILWSVAAFLAAFANWFVALVRGRSAGPLHRFLRAYIRYYAHLTAFLFLIANPFPGFTGTPGYPVDVAIGEAERQSRWITLFRIFLVIPAFFIAGALSVVLFVVSFFGWFYALARGRMPAGFRNVGAIAVRYLAQTNAYWFVITDSYPHSSPGLRTREPEPDPQLELPFPPEPGPEVAV
jgi:Domain of unknown function (DUF4389)